MDCGKDQFKFFIFFWKKNITKRRPVFNTLLQFLYGSKYFMCLAWDTFRAQCLYRFLDGKKTSHF